MDKKKIVIQFIEAGQGHIVTAEAIAECLEKKYSDNIVVIRDYAFRDSGVKALNKYEEFSIKDVTRANKNKFHLYFQLLCMKLFGERFTLKLIYSTFFRKARNELIKRMEIQNADIFVSTHFMPLHSGIVGKKKNKIKGEIIAYNPDHNTHGWWDYRSDLFITNNPAAANEAINIRKMNADKVKTVSFLARQVVIDTNESKEFYRKKYNIPENKFTVVLADGAYAAAKLEEFTDALLKSDKEITIVPICGKNEKLLNKYNEIKDQTKENITLIPMPFLAVAPEVYKAADIFVTKAGPNAITDAVFMGTPILTNFYSGEIEKKSSELFTETYKCGVYESDVKKAVKLIESWVDDPSELNEYAKNTSVIDKYKNGAEEIADMLVERLLNKKEKD